MRYVFKGEHCYKIVLWGKLLNRKALAVSIVILLFVVSSFVGVSNQTEQAPVDTNTSGTPEETLTKTGLIDSPWPMFGYDAQNTRRSHFSTEDNPGGERWRFFVDSPLLYSTPVIDSEGVLYIPNHFDKLYAIYPNGTLKWVEKLDNNGAVFQPAIGSDGTIYVGTSHYFYALFPNGTIKWTLPAEGMFRGEPVIGLNGNIFVGTRDTLYAINPNGTILWNYTLGRDVVGISLDHQNNIYFTSLSDLFSLSPNGTFRWFFNTGWLVYAPTISQDDTIYVTDGSFMYALDQDGNVIWKVDGPFGAAPSIASDGTLIATSFESSVIIAVDPSDGNTIWTYDIGRNFNVMTPASIDSDGTIYFAAFDGSIYLYAMTSTGTFKWRTELTCDYAYKIAYIDACPSIGEDGTVYVTTCFSGDDDWGYIHAIGGGKIQNVEDGYLHFFGNKILKTLLERTIVIGAFTLKVKFFHPENVEKVDVIIDNVTVCTLETPPFEYRFNTRLIGIHQIDVRGYYNDGVISSEKMEIFFLIF